MKKIENNELISQDRYLDPTSACRRCEKMKRCESEEYGSQNLCKDFQIRKNLLFCVGPEDECLENENGICRSSDDCCNQATREDLEKSLNRICPKCKIKRVLSDDGSHWYCPNCKEFELY